VRVFIAIILAFSCIKANATCVDFYRTIENCQRYLDKESLDALTLGRGKCDIAGQADDFLQNSPEATKSVRELNKNVADSVYKIVSNVRIDNRKMHVDNQYVRPLMNLARTGSIEAQFCASVLFEYGLGYKQSLPIAYALAAAAVAQNPPFGRERQDSIASKLSWKEQSIAVDYANRITKIITDLYDNPSVVFVN
jgi:hypothetical protein